MDSGISKEEREELVTTLYTFPREKERVVEEDKVEEEEKFKPKFCLVIRYLGPTAPSLASFVSPLSTCWD